MKNKEYIRSDVCVQIYLQQFYINKSKYGGIITSASHFMFVNPVGFSIDLMNL